MVLVEEGGQLPGRLSQADHQRPRCLPGRSLLGAWLLRLQEHHDPPGQAGQRAGADHDGAQGGLKELGHQRLRPGAVVAAPHEGRGGGAVLLAQPDHLVAQPPQAGFLRRVASQAQQRAGAGAPGGGGGGSVLVVLVVLVEAYGDVPVVLVVGDHPSAGAVGQGQPAGLLREQGAGFALHGSGVAGGHR
ncbi:hypothetical protein [Actinomyces lilanjuaniae]|uniref:hypothetical protein n=1 Tax=Actinomyces lilanjuaniae TaxID=2321394 RepID=UPI001FAA0286|nr:hypothetical protein [Actinomyces lilanjuaniae]